METPRCKSIGLAGHVRGQVMSTMHGAEKGDTGVEKEIPEKD